MPRACDWSAALLTVSGDAGFLSCMLHFWVARMLSLTVSLFFDAQVDAARTPLAPLDALYPELDALYVDLHRTPELSSHEEKTSAKIADHLRKLQYDVTTNVGGFGVVGVMKNGKGPTV